MISFPGRFCWNTRFQHFRKTHEMRMPATGNGFGSCVRSSGRRKHLRRIIHMSEGLAKMGSTIQYAGCFPCNGLIKPTDLSETLLMFVTLVYQHISFKNILILSYSTVFLHPSKKQELPISLVANISYIHIYSYLHIPSHTNTSSCQRNRFTGLVICLQLSQR